MAMTLSDVSNVLQKIIAPRIEEELPTETIWYDMVSKNAGVTPMANNTFYITLRTGRQSGIAAITEGDTLATGKQAYSQALVNAKWVFGTFDITDQTIESAKGDPGALVNILTENSAILRKDMARELNRMFWGFGDGTIAVVRTSAGPTATITLNNYQDLLDTNAETVIEPTKYISVGNKLLIDTDLVTVVSVDSASQITVTPAITVVDGDLVKRASGSGAAVDEPMGARGIIDDGSLVPTLQSIARASNPFWKAYVNSAGGALSETDMVTAYLKAKEFGNPKFILMNYKLFKKYGSLLLSYKKSANTVEVLQGGWTGLDFAAASGRVSVVVDYDCPDREVHFIDPDSMTLAQLAPMEWLDRGEGILRRVDTASYQGVLKWYGNLAVKNVRANAKMTARTS